MWIWMMLHKHRQPRSNTRKRDGEGDMYQYTAFRGEKRFGRNIFTGREQARAPERIQRISDYTKGFTELRWTVDELEVKEKSFRRRRRRSNGDKPNGRQIKRLAQLVLLLLHHSCCYCCSSSPPFTTDKLHWSGQHLLQSHNQQFKDSFDFHLATNYYYYYYYYSCHRDSSSSISINQSSITVRQDLSFTFQRHKLSPGKQHPSTRKLARP